MKELSIEEKAKAYDNLIERLKDLKFAYRFSPLSDTIEEKFHELKENEDDKMKKIISDILLIDSDEIREILDTNNVLIQDIDNWLEKQSKNNMGISKATKQELDDNLHKALEKETPESWNKFLDEQGNKDEEILILKDQIESLHAAIKAIKETHRIELKKQGEQKSADKVEPKFHEGDCIIHQGTKNIYQVVARIDNQYQLKYGDNYTIQYCEDIDRCTRLWDITKDAKDGDVLASGQLIIIFKKFKEETDWNFVIAYAGIDISGKLQVTNEHWLINNNTKPASKEQRDLLFQKMKEAGYEWDAEHKQLYKQLKKEKVDNLHNYLYGEQKPAWSKEDEYVIETMFCLLHNEQDKYPQQSSEFQELEEIENKLKSLKDRVQPQPKQEWSEEDERTYKSILYAFEHNYPLNSEQQKFVKSLKNKYTWKPSDEQIEAIKEALSLAKNCGEEWAFDLRTLYEQLKKLREE